MNKRQKGKYRLEFRDWAGSVAVEWYRDKPRAVARKEELERFNETNCMTFTDIKIEFVPEAEIPFRR